MNERIKELLTQAGVGDNWNEADWYSLSPEMVEKFAELIVAETISVLQKRFMGDLNREDMEVRKCIEDVKNHFAVKE